MPSLAFKEFPDVGDLLDWRNQRPPQRPVPSNLHIHTPYSFSAFSDVNEAVRLAREQGVLILGISDFNTTKGYEEFTEECQSIGVFPAYCMETIALSVEDQKSGIRWNDPNNPGRIYFCGKGMQCPSQHSKYTQDTLHRIADALERQSRQMIDRVNHHLKDTLPDIRLDYDHIRDTITKGTVRERHVAKALQQAISKIFPNAAEKAKALKKLYGKESQVDVMDDVALQEELRSNLLKAGKAAFVEESPEAYLSFEEARSLILDMGGIPCYPVLADGTRGVPTEIERDPEALCDELLQRSIYCAEFIPIRNDINLLREYVSVFKRKGIVLTTGTEHNTPKMEPMVPGCRGGVDLDETLKEAFWKGACVVAAHQYLLSAGRTGFVDINEDVKRLESIGAAVIAYYLKEFKRGKENGV